MRILIFLLIINFALGCGSSSKDPVSDEISSSYAQGFSIDKTKDGYLLKVRNPWPNATKTFTYLLLQRPLSNTKTQQYDAIINVPVKNIIVTSTSHVASLEMLSAQKALIGFPGLDYISSPGIRDRIEEFAIQDIGRNESLDIEKILNLNPDVVIGFSINNENNALKLIGKSGIPIILNGDWTENTPLGRAEWIKVFGVLLGKEKMADSLFSSVEKAYLKARSLVPLNVPKPSVLSGGLYQDVWYLPAGNSYQAKLFEDAGMNYLWSESEGVGSLSLSLESVLDKASSAQLWVGPAQYATYEEMNAGSTHYQQFECFREHRVFTFNLTKGETGGTIYYELGPLRPDLILTDLIAIAHPDLIPHHRGYFFKPMEVK